jgi:glyceraldehyde 3-phosphate dehydrogenase
MERNANSKIKVGINGFGRIGRAVFRVLLSRDIFDVVAINDINDDLDSLAYLLKYDSIHGRLTEKIEVQGDSITCGDFVMKVFSEYKIEEVPWNNLGVEIVIGCTGSLHNVANARKCMGATVKKVLFSDSPEAVDHTFVFGVSDSGYDHEKHDVVAASICDVVGLAPVLKKIDEVIGIQSGFVTSLHPWLFYQNIMDGKSKSSAFSDKPWTKLAIGRASVGNLIPKDTTLVPALERAMPEIKGKLLAMSYRVPTDVVASAIGSLVLEKDTSKEEVKELLSSSSNPPFLDYTEEPMISIDYKHCESSCVVDGKWVEVLDKRLLRLITWYDNEWGYSARLVDVIKYMGEKL